MLRESIVWQHVPPTTARLDSCTNTLSMEFDMGKVLKLKALLASFEVERLLFLNLNSYNIT